jgi:hypothetical protein
MAPFANVIIYPSWQPQYFSALRELNAQVLTAKITAVREAMFRRSAELKTDADNPERLAMQEAARQLKTLRVSVFGYLAVSLEESDQQHN